MKAMIRIAIMLAVLLTLTLAVTAKNFPTQEPMGGELFGHSVKNLGNGLYVFRW